MKTDLVDSAGPFDLEYNVIYAKHDSPWQIQTEFLLTQVKTNRRETKRKIANKKINFFSKKILQIGLCLPKSCDAADVWNITQSYFDEENVGFATEYEFQPKVVRVKTLNVEMNFFKKISVQLIGLEFNFYAIFKIEMKY